MKVGLAALVGGAVYFAGTASLFCLALFFLGRWPRFARALKHGTTDAALSLRIGTLLTAVQVILPLTLGLRLQVMHIVVATYSFGWRAGLVGALWALPLAAWTGDTSGAPLSLLTWAGAWGCLRARTGGPRRLGCSLVYGVVLWLRLREVFSLVPPLAVLAVAMGATVGWVTLRMVEIIADEPLRRTAQVLSRVLAMLAHLPETGPGIGPELCQVIREALGIPGCLAWDREGRLLGCAGPAHEPGEGRDWQRGWVADHRTLLRCSGRCSGGPAWLLPLSNGEEVEAWLVLLPGQLDCDPGLIEGLGSLLSLQLMQRRLRAQEDSLRQTRWRLLTAQLRPTFLFQVLQAVSAVSATDPFQAEEMVVQLAHFLRRSFTVEGDFQRLEAEWETTHLYLQLEQARMGRLEVDCPDLPRELGPLQVPSMLVQPVVEACLSALPELETVSVRAAGTAAELTFEVTVRGRGPFQVSPTLTFSPQDLEERARGLGGPGSRLQLEGREGEARASLLLTAAT